MGRQFKTEGGKNIQYLYDGMNPVQETSGTTVNPILTGLGIDERYARNDTNGRMYFLTDALGSTRALTSTVGTIKNRYDYDPYGNGTQAPTVPGTTFSNPYQYTGRELDQTGMYFNRARYYQPAMGRFISEDPIGFGGGVNAYAYVDADPLEASDTFGLTKIIFFDPHNPKQTDLYSAKAEPDIVGTCTVYVHGASRVVDTNFRRFYDGDAAAFNSLINSSGCAPMTLWFEGLQYRVLGCE